MKWGALYVVKSADYEMGRALCSKVSIDYEWDALYTLKQCVDCNAGNLLISRALQCIVKRRYSGLYVPIETWYTFQHGTTIYKILKKN